MFGVLASSHQCHPKFFAARIYHLTTKKVSEGTQSTTRRRKYILQYFKIGGQKDYLLHVLVTDLTYQLDNCTNAIQALCQFGSKS
jgi:hypothetical protein